MKLLIFALLLPTLALATELRPFESDGCTMSPDGTFGRPELWRECCVAHDLRFWGGGSKEERKDADQKLKACVEEKAGSAIAAVFFAGVRVGSLSPWKLPSKKWGNAWYDQAGYRSLSEDELAELKAEVEKLDLPQDIRIQYLSEIERRVTEN